jgi:triphosphatase
VHRDWPAEIQAAEQLSRRRKKIKKKAKLLDQLDPASRHKLRIQVKKTRYAAEFFGGLFRQKKAARRSEKLLRALRSMQTALGGLNDVAHRRELCTDLVSSRRGEQAKEATQSRAFAAGLISGDQDARTQALLDDAIRAYVKFADVKPFWKLKELLPLETKSDEADPA